MDAGAVVESEACGVGSGVNTIRPHVDVFGAGLGLVAFEPVARGALGGKRIENKICELCGKNFFRDAGQKECARCVARLANAEKPVPTELIRPKGPDYWEEPKRLHKVTLPQVVPQSVWDAWQAQMEATPQLECGATVDATRCQATNRKGPRIVLTPEERKRRRLAWRAEYRIRNGIKPRPVRTLAERRARALEQQRRYSREYHARRRALARLASASTTIQ